MDTGTSGSVVGIAVGGLLIAALFRAAWPSCTLCAMAGFCLLLRTRIHNHSTPSERVFCRPAALKNLAIHKVLSAFFRLAGQQNPSPIRHPLIMNTGSKKQFLVFKCVYNRRLAK